MSALPLIALLASTSVGAAAGAETNLVFNGAFEIDKDVDGVPDGWQTSGHPSIKQQIVIDAGREGGRCAKLLSTHFEGDSGWHHVMICQLGVVGVARGKWYRLTFWTKSEGRQASAASVALSNTQTWQPTGLYDAFSPGRRWKRFEFLFNAAADVPAKISRLQFWFQGVGALWLDDVELKEVQFSQTWHPEIAAEGVGNFVPNSSFECGTAGWGSFTPKPGRWGANLYQLVGSLDPTTAVHGQHSLKIDLAGSRLPILYFDYYDPYAEPVRAVLAANRGWFKVDKGRPYVLSASMRASKPGTVGLLGAVHAEGGFASTRVTVGTDWRRYHFVFRPRHEFVHIAVGLDLEASKMEEAALWIDAVQLEPGLKPTDYRPRHPVEALVSTPALGNIFTAPEKGLDVCVRAFNDEAEAVTLEGNLTVSDFFERGVAKESVVLRLPAGGSERWLRGLAAGRRGFFRVNWRHRAGGRPEEQTLRSAVIDQFVGQPPPAGDYSQARAPAPHRGGQPPPAGDYSQARAPAPQGTDSRLGMNHAYPCQFLLELSRQAGILWWRDWSVKWDTVERAPGKFDFRQADTQIDRVRAVGGRVLVLFPFASAVWASSADAKQVAEAAGGSDYLRQRLPTAFAARRMADFEGYIRQSVRHYRGRISHYQVLNEPLYTTYALPARFGYKMADYVAHVEAVHRVAKEEQPGCVIVGGIGCSPAAGQAREFVEAGGLRSVDVVDIHVYAAPGRLDWLEDSLRGLQQVMRQRKELRPIWITEFGCYADDDPACVPARVGDQTMQRCSRPSEREASEDVVRLLAMFAAYGVEKVFFHAGTAPAINQPDAGGVFFEYGGEPRKMYAAAAALARLLPAGSRFVKADLLGEALKSYTFKTPTGLCTVAWSAEEEARQLTLRPGVVALDITGSQLEGDSVTISTSPVYLTTTSTDPRLFAP